MKKVILALTAFLTLSLCANAQNGELDKLRTSHLNRHHELLNEYAQFCSLPNTWNDPEQLRQNAAFIVEMMKKRGISNARTLEVSVPGAIPAVYGEILTPGATRTLVFYAHYDGQPVNPSKWAEGLSPLNLNWPPPLLTKEENSSICPKLVSHSTTTGACMAVLLPMIKQAYLPSSTLTTPCAGVA